MKHEYHVGGFVRSTAPVPVLMSSGLCGLLASKRRAETIQPSERTKV